jgi:hypothetical protein
MDSQGLQVLQGPVDHLRQGFNSWEQQYAAPHPVQIIQNRQDFEWKLKLDTVRRTYGSHMAMRLATEKQMHSRMKRLPGLQSSHIALDTLMGEDTSIGFQDFLNGMLLLTQCFFLFLNWCMILNLDPHSRPVVPKVDVHGQMEIKLGLL